MVRYPFAMTGIASKDEVFLHGEVPSLNHAKLEELMRVDGIGPVLANAILRHREYVGPFHAIHELLMLPGVDEKRFDHVATAVTL